MTTTPLANRTVVCYHCIFYSIMANGHKTYKCVIRFPGSGNPAITEIIEANNPPQARQFAEARFPGGKCSAANQVYL